jgi:hypothetical protein
MKKKINIILSLDLNETWEFIINKLNYMFIATAFKLICFPTYIKINKLSLV